MEEKLMNRRRDGFTLIELLVVIAVIAIVAGMLFPVFAQARKKARTTSCLSNCKQIATGLMLYAQDYDESILPWYLWDGMTVADDFWTGHIQPYLRNGAPVLAGGNTRRRACCSAPPTAKQGSGKRWMPPTATGPA